MIPVEELDLVWSDELRATSDGDNPLEDVIVTVAKSVPALDEVERAEDVPVVEGELIDAARDGLDEGNWAVKGGGGGGGGEGVGVTVTVVPGGGVDGVDGPLSVIWKKSR